jgi:hypothetical protein
VAVSYKRAHAKFGGQCQGLPVVGFGRRSLREIAMRGGQRRGRCSTSTASPDQHSTVLVDGDLVHCNNFGLQISEIVGIEAKLPLQARYDTRPWRWSMAMAWFSTSSNVIANPPSVKHGCSVAATSPRSCWPSYTTADSARKAGVASATLNYSGLSQALQLLRSHTTQFLQYGVRVFAELGRARDARW